MRYLKIFLILTFYGFFLINSLLPIWQVPMNTKTILEYDNVNKEIDIDPTPKELQWVDKYDTIYVEDGVTYKLRYV